MKQLILSFFVLAAISCTDNFEYAFGSSVEEETDNSSEFYLLYRNKHPTREKTLDQAKHFYGGTKVCEDFRNCVKVCTSLFQYDFDQKDCKKLPRSLVNRFKLISKAFERKKFYGYQGFNLFDLKVFLSFSLEPSVRLFSKLGSSSTKDLLKRIAYSWDIAQILVQEDLDFILLETLLNEVATEPISALGETVENKKSFQEIALMKQNDFAIFLVHGFFNKLCDNKEECILNHYCSVSKNYNENDLLELSNFKSLKEILSKQKEKDSTLKTICPTL